LKDWKTGIMEDWNNEELALVELPNIPSFHPSIIPAFYYSGITSFQSSIIPDGCALQREYFL
jgi:hypothetical protein